MSIVASVGMGTNYYIQARLAFQIISFFAHFFRQPAHFFDSASTSYLQKKAARGLLYHETFIRDYPPYLLA